MPSINTLRRDLAARFAAQPWAVAIAAVAALTVWRVAGLALAQTDLYTDEAQYWFWSTAPALGYFSKPPLVAWTIRAFTELGGSESPFWVRLAAPLFHALAAAAVGALGAAAFGRRAGALSAIIYATMPAVSVGSIVISTDTLLLPFVALSLLAWLQTARTGSLAWALALGAAVGCGLYAKYAMLYMPLCMALGAAFTPALRLAWRRAAAAAAVALILAAPHLVWLAGAGFITAGHVAADAQAGAGPLRPDKLAEFLGAQLGVFGPILLPAWLYACWRAFRDSNASAARGLVWASLPILVLMSIQALRAGAEANWAAAAYAAATPLAATALLGAPRLLALTLALQAVVAVVIPLLPAAPEAAVAPNGRPVLSRLIGREAVAQRVGAVASSEGLRVIVSSNRGLLSDLLYTLRDQRRAGGVVVYAPAPDGAPSNHFEMTIPLPAGLDAPALLVTRSDPPEPYDGLEPALRLETIETPASGFMKGRDIHLWRMEPAP
jgi:4-amino-4-deoxy-L-arabinose transferase-like glycosyltransferase